MKQRIGEKIGTEKIPGESTTKRKCKHRANHRQEVETENYYILQKDNANQYHE